MSSSLDSLVNNLARGGNEFFGFEEYNENQYKLLIKKGIHPYEHMNDWDKFKENKLPPKEAFYSKLNMTGLEKKIMNTGIEFGKSLYSKIWGNTTIYTKNICKSIGKSFRSI